MGPLDGTNEDGVAIARRLRAMNDRARLDRDRFTDDAPSSYAVMCECTDPACASMLTVPPDKYDLARQGDAWFIVDVAHAGDARVVERHGDWYVVHLDDA